MGEPYKMSKRAGNVILMSDITEEIGSDVLRFIFLISRMDSSFRVWYWYVKKSRFIKSNFYINYAHARINQAFKKAEVTFDNIKM